MPIEYPANQVWPPQDLQKVYQSYEEYGAWYRGREEELWRYYARIPNSSYPQVRPSQLRGGVVGWLSRTFWGRPSSSASNPGHLHVPAAADLSALSSDLLFSEAPAFKVDDSAPTQDWLQKMLQCEGVYAVFGEAGEYASAYGSAFFRVTVDVAVCDSPIVETIPASCAIPEWRYGRLAAVTFWRPLPAPNPDGTTVWRHLERHEPGRNWHALYRGGHDRLGVRAPLSDRADELAALIPLLGPDGSVETGIDILDCAHWPNLRPNRAHEGSPLGRSDYDAGGLGLMDSLDETWSLWMEDLRLARARLIVPEQYLTGLGPGRGATFNADQRIFTAIRATDPDKPLQIEKTQFDIRVQQHADTAAALWRAIVKHAGLSADAFGEEPGTAAATATEIGQRGARTVATRKRKIDYAQQALSHVARVIVLLGVAHRLVPTGVGDDEIRVVFPDGVTPDALKIANTVHMLDAAGAVSLRTKIAMAQPDWDDEQVEAEALAIEGEKSSAAAAMTVQDPGTFTGAAPAPDSAPDPEPAPDAMAAMNGGRSVGY